MITGILIVGLYAQQLHQRLPGPKTLAEPTGFSQTQDLAGVP
jgi:hypothetical protein